MSVKILAKHIMASKSNKPYFGSGTGTNLIHTPVPRRFRPRALAAMNVRHVKIILVGDGGVMDESCSGPLEEAHKVGERCTTVY